MENNRTIKALAIALIAGAGLSGCVAIPAYGPPPGYGPQVYSPVVIAPWFGFGFHGGGRGYYGGHGHY